MKTEFGKEFDKEILRIKSDINAQNDLIEKYRPYILSCASKASGRFISKSDEEASIALLAFSESIRSYNPDMGSFLSFSKKVITRRIIDFMRKESRYNSLNESLDEHLDLNQIDSSYDRQNEILMEIKQLKTELSFFNISFSDLVKTSPKAGKTKNFYMQVAFFLLRNESLLTKFISNHIFPIKDIQNIFKVPRKRIERGRNYIIATVLILSGDDYDYLKEYVRLLQ